MKLFSKRNKSVYRDEDSRYISRGPSRLNTELVSLETRNRLIAEIKFLTSSDDFLEWFILFENRKKGKIFFDKEKIDSFSLSELGYSMSTYFSFEDFSFLPQERKSRISETMESFFDDYRLFDLAEIVILFSKDDKRLEVIKRFNSIFFEESSDFQIVEHLITRKSGETLKTLVNLLKDENLKKKIKTYYEQCEGKDYINAAKISADILNIVFSGYIKNNKPTDISRIKEKLAEKIVKGGAKRDEKILRFISHIDELLRNSKSLTNDIYDVRHTERSTIQLTNDNIYKLIANQNMALVELVLTTLKDDYVLGDNWETIKAQYIDKYRIDRTTRFVIDKPVEIAPNEINPEDIPF